MSGNNASNKVEPKSAPYKPSRSPLRSTPAERRESTRRVVHEKCRVQLFTEEILASGGKPVEAIITDLSKQGFGLCTNKNLPTGAPVIIEIKARENEGKLQAKVVWCNKLPVTGRIIKENPLPWRAGLLVTISTEEETALMKSLLESL